MFFKRLGPKTGPPRGTPWEKEVQLFSREGDGELRSIQTLAVQIDHGDTVAPDMYGSAPADGDQIGHIAGTPGGIELYQPGHGEA